MTRRTVNVANMFATYYYDTFANKAEKREPKFTSYEWVTTTMNQSKAYYKMFRLRRPVLDNLHEELSRNYGLESTTSMSFIECLAMFL
jgi:hypothetical protein